MESRAIRVSADLALAVFLLVHIAIADDAVGLVRVDAGTNGLVEAEMPFSPIGDSGPLGYVSGAFLGDGGEFSDQLFRYDASTGETTNAVQSASVPLDGSGQVVLFALMQKKEGEVYPVVPEMRAEDILFADILRLVCESTDARYVIRDDGVVVVWPPDFCCECNYMPGEEWRSPIGTWPRRSSFVEGCRGKVFRQD